MKAKHTSSAPKVLVKEARKQGRRDGKNQVPRSESGANSVPFLGQLNKKFTAFARELDVELEQKKLEREAQKVNAIRGEIQQKSASDALSRNLAHAEANLAKAEARLEGGSEEVTSMNRFGIGINNLAEVSNLNLKGISLHFPIGNTKIGKTTEVANWINSYKTLCLSGQKVVYLSHISESELKNLTNQFPDFKFKVRVGTKLWIGDLKAFQIKSTVLEVHEPVNQIFGYRQRSITSKHRLIVVSGGTAHGIGLQAPRSNVTIKQRLVAMLSGIFEAFDYHLSPFLINGKQRWFAESPHMNVSLLKLPSNISVPKVGSTISAQVRMTTTNFDCVVIR